MTFASQRNGPTSHLGASLFMTLTGTDRVHVPYKGTAPALVDPMAGQVDLFFDNLSSSMDPHHAGKVRILAVWADSRAMLEDRVSTLREPDIYERQRCRRHRLGLPVILEDGAQRTVAETAFMVARIMATGQTELFASGVYRDRERDAGDALRLAERVAVCDSTVTDTLLALPL